MSAAAISLALQNQAMSQTAPVPRAADVLITATRSESRVDETSADITIIGPEEIRASAGLTLSDLLSRQPGIQLGSNGGRGALSSIFIRGNESRHTLVLLNGIRFADLSFGAVDFSAIPLEQIDRIEIIRGPASNFYGSDAIGGVINVITNATETGFRPYAKVELGSNEYQSLSTGTSGALNGAALRVGYTQAYQNAPSATNSKQFRFNPDRDPFFQKSLSLSGSYPIAQGWTLNADLLGGQSTVHYDDSGASGDGTRSENSSSIASTTLKGSLTDRLKTQIQLGRSSNDSTDLETPRSGRRYSAQRIISWDSEYKFSLGKVQFGLDGLGESAMNYRTGSSLSRHTNAIRLAVLSGSGPHSIEAAYRHDESNSYGGADTGGLNYGYQATQAGKAYVSAATSFRAPAMAELAFAFDPKELKAERGFNREVGWVQAFESGQLRVAYFQNEIVDYLGINPQRACIANSNFECADPRAFTVENFGPVNIKGVSAAMSTKQGPYFGTVAVDLLDAEDVTGRQLPRRAKQALNLTAGYKAGAWYGTFNMQSRAQRYDIYSQPSFVMGGTVSDSPSATLGGYTTLDATLLYKINAEFTAGLRLQNLTDKVYETAEGFNQPRRSVFLTLSWRAAGKSGG